MSKAGRVPVFKESTVESDEATTRSRCLPLARVDRAPFGAGEEEVAVCGLRGLAAHAALELSLTE